MAFAKGERIGPRIQRLVWQKRLFRNLLVDLIGVGQKIRFDNSALDEEVDSDVRMVLSS